MAQGKRPDVDGLAALVSWSGLKTEDYVRSHRTTSPAGTACYDLDLPQIRQEPQARGCRGPRRSDQGHLREAQEHGVVYGTSGEGFKSEAAALARDIRAELGFGPLDRLDPHQLAQHLGILNCVP